MNWWVRLREFVRNYIPINRFELELRVRAEVELEVAQWRQEVLEQVAAISEHLWRMDPLVAELGRRLEAEARGDD